MVLARAGSKGLVGKNERIVAGRPMLTWTLEHALGSALVDRVVLSTDSTALLQLAEQAGVHRIARPAHLATDTATVQDAAAHAVEESERLFATQFAQVVLLYANVPIRPMDLTDRAVRRLCATGCDSVQSVCEVGKHHPYWMKRLAGVDGEQLVAFRRNSVDRRQNLPPVYELDGGIIAVRRSLLQSGLSHPHAFLGEDRRAVVTQRGDVVDVDDCFDLAVAETILREQEINNTVESHRMKQASPDAA